MPIRFEGLTLYTAEDLTEKLDVSSRTISRLLREGRIRGRKLARKWFVTEEALRDYFEGGALSRNGAVLERLERLLLEIEQEQRTSGSAGSTTLRRTEESRHNSELRDLILKRFRESLEEDDPDSPWLEAVDNGN